MIGTLDNEPRHNPRMQFKGLDRHQTDNAEIIVVDYETYLTVVKDRFVIFPGNSGECIKDESILFSRIRAARLSHATVLIVHHALVVYDPPVPMHVRDEDWYRGGGQ